MSFVELLLFGIGLSMDAFAVSICKGLSVRKLRPKHAITVGLWFGGFQALMPLIGYLLGKQFEWLITSIDHWIAFILLALIGAKYKSKAEFLGGAVLILLGLKILLEDLGFLPF